MGFWSFAEVTREEESLLSTFKWLTLSWALMLVAIFFYVNIPNTQVQSTTFIFMALASGFAIAFLEVVANKINFDVTFMGKAGAWIWAGIFGLAFGLFFVFIGGQSIVALSVAEVNTLIVAIIVIGLFAPVFEEMIFRVAVLSVLPMLLKDKLPKGFLNINGLILSAGAWALFHVGVLGASIESLWIIFIIGIIYVVANQYIFKSTAFSIAAHITNNIVVVLITFGVFLI
jgi:membrane protease YdiL (CAAX protease family)